jgi:hypothetical protein
MQFERSRATVSSWYAPAALVIASAYFAHRYVSLTPSFMNLTAYAHGQERLPFQSRVLMQYPLLLAEHSAFFQRLTAHQVAIRTPELLMLEMVSFLALLLAGWSAIKIYRLASPAARMPYLPFAILIVLCFFNFVVGTPFSFPYDLPSMAFLGWGTYFVLRRRFAWLLPLFIVATFNRETTLFLILISALVAMTEDGRLKISAVKRSDVMQISVLSVVWAGISWYLHHLYAHNPTGLGPRVVANLHTLTHPIEWLQILSASAYLIPYVFLMRGEIRYAPLRSCALILPLWVIFLLTFGNITEIRIYGDISVFVAVAATLIFATKMGGQQENVDELAAQ